MGNSSRGFASMSPEKQKEIASKGGKAAHQKGTAHQFTSEEARAAGRKGGQASGVSRAKKSEKGGDPNVEKESQQPDSQHDTGAQSQAHREQAEEHGREPQSSAGPNNYGLDSDEGEQSQPDAPDYDYGQ